mmetsp:Transcript_44897/g.142997  ORF Transcript_44897/g.142997 Transcript_44897/m.142997 type:complete len:252 (+) Transcript_44897:662-1417(+)
MDLHLGDLGAEPDVRRDAVAVAGLSHVRQDLSCGGPVAVLLDGHEAVEVAVVDVVLELVLWPLRLQLGRRVRDAEPRIAAERLHAVHEDVGHLPPRVVHRLPQAHGARADDEVGEGILQDALDEALHALDEDAALDLVAVPVPLVAGPVLEDKLQLQRVHATPVHLGQEALHVPDLGGDHDGKGDLLAGAEDLEGDVLPSRAGVLPVLHRLRRRAYDAVLCHGVRGVVVRGLGVRSHASARGLGLLERAQA